MSTSLSLTFSLRGLMCARSLKSVYSCELKLFSPTRTFDVILKRCVTDETGQSADMGRNFKRKKNVYIVPELTKSQLSQITTIAGISMGIRHVSWIKISLPALDVVDWNAKIMPPNFKDVREEPKIMKVAYEMKHAFPKSDLYVMETFSMRGRDLYEKINHLHLSSMLSVLLNGVTHDIDEDMKVVFQKKHVLNRLFDLEVGNERVSTRFLLEEMINNDFKSDTECDKDSEKNIFSLVKIHPKLLDTYKDSSMEKREDLSLAFLFTLSFIDINVFENEKSVSKIQNTQYKRLKVSPQ